MALTTSLAMKTLHPLLIPALLGALTTPAFAQTAGSGLLGKRYAEASAFLIEYNHFEDDGYGVGTAVNLPVAAHFDVGATFQHNWLEGDGSEDFQDLTAYLTAYTECGDFRPYARASLAYEWWGVSDDPWYQLDAGSEYLVTDRLSVSAQISWTEFLATDWNGGDFSATARANYWFTDSVAGSVNVGYVEGGSWSTGAAVVFGF